MEFISIHSALLLVSILLLISQLFVAQKKTIHLVFAVFCGSIAMMAAKQLGGTQLGNYQYIVGMGMCATCNGFWLVARALFREKSPFTLRHLIAAVALGLMIILGQGLGLIQSLTSANLVVVQHSQSALYEVVNLFSSSMLVLTAWEGCRGLRQARGEQFWQRIVFLASYCAAVLICTVAVQFAESPQSGEALDKLLSAACALQIMVITQGLIYWRYHRSRQASSGIIIKKTTQLTDVQVKNPLSDIDNSADRELAKQITHVLNQQNLFLQANLKVADLARKMDVSEYRISRVFREHLNARNFNQYINEMRIKHAARLLENPQNTHWPIVVVGFESGFASVGPFTRAFKSFVGVTPNQYRQNHMSQVKQVDCS